MEEKLGYTQGKREKNKSTRNRDLESASAKSQGGTLELNADPGWVTNVISKGEAFKPQG